MNSRLKKIVLLAMLGAIGYVVMYVIHIPMLGFLTYDPKDVIVTIGGFIMGPLAAVIISFVVATAEMITVSSTGPIGWLMNFLAGCSFACTAAFIYKKKHTLSGAITGLLGGCLCMTGVMLLLNYLLTPIYMHVPRSEVVGMLIPMLLPFNLMKSIINSALVMLLYKPVVSALRKSGLVNESSLTVKGKYKIGVLLVSLAVIGTVVLIVLALNGVI